MNKVFSDKSWEEYIYWESQDKKILRKINSLLKEIDRTPYEGIGKPEPLKHSLSSYWSRRITDKHRLIYKIDGDAIHIVSCKEHYE